ncbi:MAG: DUF669 domain-containing protein [Pirellulaceae bacterium]
MSQYDDSFAPTDNDVDLSDFDDDFSSAESPSFDEVPDGKYQARIDSVRLDRSQKGDPMIKWDLIVIAGQHSGRHIFKNSVITPAALPFVKGDLKTVGLELAKFSDLAGRLDEVLDRTMEITKRTRGEYTNVYFNKRIQLAGAAASAPPAGDVPF